MKYRVTKQVKAELKDILDKHGYWSKEIQDYLSQFDYCSRKNLHAIAQVYDKYQYGL